MKTQKAWKIKTPFERSERSIATKYLPVAAQYAIKDFLRESGGASMMRRRVKLYRGGRAFCVPYTLKSDNTNIAKYAIFDIDGNLLCRNATTDAHRYTQCKDARFMFGDRRGCVENVIDTMRGDIILRDVCRMNVLNNHIIQYDYFSRGENAIVIYDLNTRRFSKITNVKYIAQVGAAYGDNIPVAYCDMSGQICLDIVRPGNAPQNLLNGLVECHMYRDDLKLYPLMIAFRAPGLPMDYVSLPTLKYPGRPRTRLNLVKNHNSQTR